MRKWGEKALTLSQQLLFLKANPNVEGEGSIKNGKLSWRFLARPTSFSRAYTVRIEYALNNSPNVFVERPDLFVLADNRALPHVYHNPLRLCLYMPSTGQWSAAKRLDQTIVPWALVWLYYFEDWLAFDEWRGGGKHPSTEPESAMNRSLRRSLARH